MAHIFIDDGYPEASEYDQNYIYVEEDNPDSLARLRTLLDGQRESNNTDSNEWLYIGDDEPSWFKQIAVKLIKKISSRGAGENHPLNQGVV